MLGSLFQPKNMLCIDWGPFVLHDFRGQKRIRTLIGQHSTSVSDNKCIKMWYDFCQEYYWCGLDGDTIQNDEQKTHKFELEKKVSSHQNKTKQAVENPM